METPPGSAAPGRQLRVGPAHLHDPDGRPYRQFWRDRATPAASPADVAARHLPPSRHRMPLTLLLVPPGAELDDVPEPGILQGGLTRVDWAFGPPLPDPPAETVRGGPDGDRTVVDVAGTLVALTYVDEGGTHLAWRPDPGTGCTRVRMLTPFPPLAAVERLARDPELLPPRGTPG
ncbi:hypothetical protein ACFFKU_04320 [Kineococcus gynurae]|uniref:Uncharacterized protein n=1 Tax=Kineococcus gynurae TaxID=452979 RepID=A0ABV5LRG6_9ACTN